MDNYIPRALMPQVDGKFLPQLVATLYQDNHNPTFEVVDPDTLHAHQRCNAARARSMPLEVALKPVLVSHDNYVVDGNHRWWYHKYNGDSPMSIIRMGLLFDDAIAWLKKQPYVYEITPATPERN